MTLVFYAAHATFWASSASGIIFLVRRLKVGRLGRAVGTVLGVLIAPSIYLALSVLR